MIELLTIYLAISFFSAIIIISLFKNAPEGFEDEDGFHYASEQEILNNAPKNLKYKYSFQKEGKLQRIN